jgi:cytochrome c oxidase subunit 4
MRGWLPPRALVLCWLGLLGLLALTVFAAYQPLGALNTPIALVIALLKALLVAAVFMELYSVGSLMLVFAGAGAFWLFLILWLAFADYLTRPNFPPSVNAPFS